MVVLIDARPGAAAIDPETASDLARLGVTSVTVVRDRAGMGVVLDGWAFNPAQAGDEAAAIVSGGRGTRALRPLLTTAVTSTKEEGT